MNIRLTHVVAVRMSVQAQGRDVSIPSISMFFFSGPNMEMVWWVLVDGRCFTGVIRWAPPAPFIDEPTTSPAGSTVHPAFPPFTPGHGNVIVRPSSSLPSSTTNSRLCYRMVALCQRGLFDPVPRPPRPYCTFPTMSAC